MTLKHISLRWHEVNDLRIVLGDYISILKNRKALYDANSHRSAQVQEDIDVLNNFLTKLTWPEDPQNESA